MFNRAIDWGLIGVNPVKGVKLPKADNIVTCSSEFVSARSALKTVTKDKLYSITNQILPQ